MKKNKIKNAEKITAVFTGGGTGGHIYPGLAIADELKELCRQENIPLNIVWIGCSKKMDKKIVESSIGLDSVPSVNKFYSIPSGKLRRIFR